MHVMDLYYEWKGLILHLAYRQGYLLSLLGGGENMEFPGGSGEMESGISPGVKLKITGNFQGWSKTSCVEFPKFLVLGLNTILLSSQRWSFVLSEISRGKVRKLKFSGFFSKKVFSQHPSVFSGIALYWKYKRKYCKIFPHLTGPLGGLFILDIFIFCGGMYAML